MCICICIYIYIYQSDNIGALKLYEKLGFVRDEKLGRYYLHGGRHIYICLYVYLRVYIYVYIFVYM
jgi:ribosomal protein S18 acetylase RimI-like enzyme